MPDFILLCTCLGKALMPAILVLWMIRPLASGMDIAMKITCPNCTTSYQVPDDYIGEEGRAVRCANCGETWQAKEEAPASAVLEEGLDTSQSDIDALFDEGGAGEEQSQDDIDALFDSAAEGEDQSQDDIDELFDSPAAEEDQSQDDIDALFDGPAAGEEQNQDDIDALFGEENASVDAPLEEEAVSSSPIMVTADEDHALPPVVEGLDADTFETHKAIARGRDIESSVRRRKRSNRRRKAKKHAAETFGNRNEWIIGGVALVASLVIVLGLLVLPQPVVRLMPDFASLYATVGIEVNLSGVKFDAIDVSLVQQTGAPVVSVQAELVNPGAEPVILPSIQLSILGNDDAELYSWAVDPDGGVGLGPGERKLIDTTVAAPSQARELALRIFH